MEKNLDKGVEDLLMSAGLKHKISDFIQDGHDTKTLSDILKYPNTFVESLEFLSPIERSKLEIAVSTTIKNRAKERIQPTPHQSNPSNPSNQINQQKQGPASPRPQEVRRDAQKRIDLSLRSRLDTLKATPSADQDQDDGDIDTPTDITVGSVCGVIVETPLRAAPINIHPPTAYIGRGARVTVLKVWTASEAYVQAISPSYAADQAITWLLVKTRSGVYGWVPSNVIVRCNQRNDATIQGAKALVKQVEKGLTDVANRSTGLQKLSKDYWAKESTKGGGRRRRNTRRKSSKKRKFKKRKSKKRKSSKKKKKTRRKRH